MSDQPPPDSAPSNPTRQAAWDSVSEAELDAALSHAASLAAELSGQIQSAGGPAPATGPPSGGNPLDNPRNELDAELEHLEHLVSTTAAQLQSAENTSPGASAVPAYAVPDFMAELTTPQKPAARSAPDRAPSSVHSDPVPAPAYGTPDWAKPDGASVKPGVVGSGMMGVVGGAVNIPPLAPPRAGEPVVYAECERESPPGWHVRLVAPIIVVLHGLASWLEVIDRPLARVGGRVRRISGWIAIALIMGSMMVFVRSVG